MLLPWVAALIAGCRPAPDEAVPPGDDGVASGDDDDDLEPPELVEVEQSGARTCDPTAREALGPFERRATAVEARPLNWFWGGGTIVADLDGDGWLDVVNPVDSGLLLYAGTPAGGPAAPVTAPFDGLDVSYATGGSAADYDGDGDLDLYVLRWVGMPGPIGGGYGRNLLLRNEGGFVFTDVTDEAGVSGCGADRHGRGEGCFRSMVSSWGDSDGDGDLDLYVGNYGFVDTVEPLSTAEYPPGEPDFLYRNEGDGTFTDLSDTLPIELHDGYALAGGFHDLDVDGDLDLYAVHDFGPSFPNRVLWNEGGALVFDPDDSSGLVVAMTGMGAGVGDVNGDGWPDLAVPEWMRNSLLVSRADLGIWVESSAATGFVADLARGQTIGWGTVMGDLEADGDLDLVSQYGLIRSGGAWPNLPFQPDALYVAEPDGSGGSVYTDEAAAWGIVDDWSNRAVMLADLNQDGFLDLVKRDLEGDDVMYLSRCAAAAWLAVRPRQPGTANTMAVGARLEVEDGDSRWTRTITSGGVGFASDGPPEAHFGLGDRDTVDLVRIRWPDGTASELADVQTRQTVTVTRLP